VSADYHHIPDNYCLYFGGLRWSDSFEAVESEDGDTFALLPEIGLFLEGFAAGGRLIHFGFVLHLLHLLGKGKWPAPPAAAPLRKAMKESGQALRNAGALCAQLCRGVPALAQPVRFHTQEWLAQAMTRRLAKALDGREVPPLAPERFEEHVLRQLEGYSAQELRHWLRNGRGAMKDAGPELAREVAVVRPRTLAEILAELTARERLAGAVPYVARLVSALALPPRRLHRPELPVGGYNDVTTRGHPEQILPSQLALDELEFLRRFAANELLFFRREEPQAQTREELVLVLDQGVRTWGDVRLVLTAGVLALAGRAAPTKRSVRLATTAAPALIDARTADAAKLGELLEASDLTFHPGAALERVLEEPAAVLRDVVLLTHPRNLAEPDVAAAARRVSSTTRLFAVAVDEHGDAQLAEVRHGAAVPRTRFRVQWEPAPPPPPPPEVKLPPAWTGDVEPVGFPFRFGLRGAVALFDFDASGKRLLVTASDGMLYLLAPEESATEVLPRPFTAGRLLSTVEAVRGVRGGFVVCGVMDGELTAAHYDLDRRVCKVYSLGQGGTEDRLWMYLSPLHAVVVKSKSFLSGADLGTSKQGYCNRPFKGPPASRLQAALYQAQDYVVPPGVVRFKQNPATPSSGRPPEVCLDPAGTIHLSAGAFSTSFVPTADGVPALRGTTAQSGKYRGSTLALLAGIPGNRNRLFAYRVRDGMPLGNFAGVLAYALSADGKKLAFCTNTSHVLVHDLEAGGAPVSVLSRGQFHTQVAAEPGPDCLTITIGGCVHTLRWAGNTLTHKLEGGTEDGPPIAVTAGASRTWPLAYDPRRFTIFRALGSKVVAVDSFGQVIVLDEADRVVCMFFAFRKQLAGWMPDGTRLGPAELTGGPETTDAAARFGKALAAAATARRTCEVWA
jgi:hypothetical protein